MHSNLTLINWQPCFLLNKSLAIDINRFHFSPLLILFAFYILTFNIILVLHHSNKIGENGPVLNYIEIYTFTN